MAEAGSVSYAIEITDIEARGTRLSVTTPAGLQALFHDGDMIRGLVILDVGSIHHVRNIAIDLIGQAEASVQRTDSSGGGPKSFKNKEVFLWKSQTLAGTPNNDLASSSTLAPRSPLPSPALTTQGRIVQFNKGRHFLPFELTLETGCTPGSVRWQNQDMPSHATHNVIASIHYKLRVTCQNADSNKSLKVAKERIQVGGFEHSRENLKAMASKGSGKSKMGTLPFALMDGQLTYTATLDARAYHIGDTALLSIMVDNKLPHPVMGISVRFNSYISLVASPAKLESSNSNTNLSSSTSTLATPSRDTEDNFSESEVLSSVNERYTVKPNESVKKTIPVVIPQSAFSTTKYTRLVNLMAFLDVTINVQSQTPGVSEKSFQVPIYVINKLPAREASVPNSVDSLGNPLASSSNSHRRSGSYSPSLSPHSSYRSLYASLENGGDGNVKPPGIIIWANDNEAEKCTICSNDFTIFRRRHHCRNCGRVICGKCCKDFISAELFGPKAQRTCSQCLKEFAVEDDSSSTTTSSRAATTTDDLEDSFHQISVGNGSNPDEPTTPRLEGNDSAPRRSSSAVAPSSPAADASKPASLTLSSSTNSIPTATPQTTAS